MAIGELFITVDGTTRIVHPNIRWLHAVADVLNDLGHRASHVVCTVTIHFKRDEAEEERAMALLEEVVKVRGGLNIVDLKG